MRTHTSADYQFLCLDQRSGRTTGRVSARRPAGVLLVECARSGQTVELRYLYVQRYRSKAGDCGNRERPKCRPRANILQERDCTI